MAKKPESVVTMNTNLKKNFSLVESTFTSDEAREVLMSLVKSKLTFHGLKNLRSYEKSGKGDSKSEKRIEELQKMREEILELITYAGETGQKLRINSEINVELIEFAEEPVVQ